MSKTVTVLFFATLKDSAGINSTTVELPESARVLDLKAILSKNIPGLNKAMETAITSVNHNYALDEELIPDGAEVAIFPPVSGGTETINRKPTVISILEEEIDIMDVLRHITLETTGAVCFFTGVVRGITDGDTPYATEFLEYEAYHPMAEKKMGQIAHEIRSRWPAIQGVAIIQRIGHLNSGTPAAVIACSATHRDTGVFEAARYGIDRLKEIVPIWKREFGSGEGTWIEGKYKPEPGE